MKSIWLFVMALGMWLLVGACKQKSSSKRSFNSNKSQQSADAEDESGTCLRITGGNVGESVKVDPSKLKLARVEIGNGETLTTSLVGANIDFYDPGIVGILGADSPTPGVFYYDVEFSEPGSNSKSRIVGTNTINSIPLAQLAGRDATAKMRACVTAERVLPELLERAVPFEFQSIEFDGTVGQARKLYCGGEETAIGRVPEESALALTSQAQGRLQQVEREFDQLCVAVFDQLKTHHPQTINGLQAIGQDLLRMTSDEVCSYFKTAEGREVFETGVASIDPSVRYVMENSNSNTGLPLALTSDDCLPSVPNADRDFGSSSAGFADTSNFFDNDTGGSSVADGGSKVSNSGGDGSFPPESTSGAQGGTTGTDAPGEPAQIVDETQKGWGIALLVGGGIATLGGAGVLAATMYEGALSKRVAQVGIVKSALDKLPENWRSKNVPTEEVGKIRSQFIGIQEEALNASKQIAKRFRAATEMADMIGDLEIVRAAGIKPGAAIDADMYQKASKGFDASSGARLERIQRAAFLQGIYIAPDEGDIRVDEFAFKKRPSSDALDSIEITKGLNKADTATILNNSNLKKLLDSPIWDDGKFKLQIAGGKVKAVVSKPNISEVLEMDQATKTKFLNAALESVDAEANGFHKLRSKNQEELINYLAKEYVDAEIGRTYADYKATAVAAMYEADGTKLKAKFDEEAIVKAMRKVPELLQNEQLLRIIGDDIKESYFDAEGNLLKDADLPETRAGFDAPTFRNDFIQQQSKIGFEKATAVEAKTGSSKPLGSSDPGVAGWRKHISASQAGGIGALIGGIAVMAVGGVLMADSTHTLPPQTQAQENQGINLAASGSNPMSLDEIHQLAWRVIELHRALGSGDDYIADKMSADWQNQAK